MKSVIAIIIYAGMIVTGLIIYSCAKKAETPLPDPPVAMLSVSPLQGDTSTIITLDGSGSYKNHSLKSGLQFRWDWDSDGTYDIDWSTESIRRIRYLVAGTFTITMQVRNEEGLTDTDSETVVITWFSGGNKPGVVTNSITDITQNSAKYEGEVTSDGGYPVTARGICWSINLHPTLNDNYIQNGAGTGVFSGTMTALSANTTYYARTFATNSKGTSYGNELYFVTAGQQVLQIGDQYGGGIIAYILQQGDPGYIAGEQHGFIAAPFDQSEGAAWGCYGTLIGGTSLNIGKGFDNSTAIFNGCAEPMIAARICLALELNGFNDWYLPSRDELSKMYDYRNWIGGFSPVPYWSSSEAEFNYSWFVNFYNGSSLNTSKDALQRVRAIRSF